MSAAFGLFYGPDTTPRPDYAAAVGAMVARAEANARLAQVELACARLAATCALYVETYERAAAKPNRRSRRRAK